DNVEAFGLVTADGSVVRTDSRENPDLFWALRGGGGNFGVVTEFEVKLHPLTAVTLAEGLCFETHIRRLLQFWRDFMADAPLELKWNIDLRIAPHTESISPNHRGRPMAGSSLIWAGDPDKGDSYVRRALSLCIPGSVRRQVVAFLHLQTMADSSFPHRQRYYTKSGYFYKLEDSTIDQLVDAAASIPSPQTQIELAYLGGAASQVSASETAFGDRSAPFVMNLLASWSDTSA